jgi:hypothetical protein
MSKTYLKSDHFHGGASGTGKYSDSQAALQSVECVRIGDQYSGGQIVSASPIISGLSKAAKLIHNPEPFGYYYKAFIDSILDCERLLVIGYGARDDHVNVWLNQFLKKHADNRKVVWICKLDGRSVGEPTMEKSIINSLSAPGGFVEALHWDNPRSEQTFYNCGALGLVPSGFPVSPETIAKAMEFLGSSRRQARGREAQPEERPEDADKVEG